jgi:hypothetical protein
VIRPFSPAASGQPATPTTGSYGHGLARVVADRVTGSVALALGGSTLLLYLATVLVVHRHYQQFPPHYDSIGIYASLFELVNQVGRSGLLATIPTAFASGTSWLLPAYGLLLAWAPVKAPEWLVSLNFLLLLVAQAAIVTYCRTYGFSRPRQIVAGLMPLVPGALYTWDGGIQDLRRDVQLILLALAILFLSLAYVRQPTVLRGLALGLLVGLAQWSRDNAASVILLVALPAVALALWRAYRARDVVGLVRLAVIPVVVFALLALPYFARTLSLTILRYQTSVWGVGEDRAESLMAFWWMPASVLLGGDSRFSGRARVGIVTAALLLAAVGAILARRRTGDVSVTFEQLKQPGSALLLASGAWVVISVVLYTTVVLGYGARWHAVPFLPTEVGLVAILVGLLGAVRLEPGADGHIVSRLVWVGCALLLVSAPLRMVLNQQPPLGEDGVNAIKAATFEIAERANGRPVALLAFDTLSRHHAAFYLAQAGQPLLTEFEPVANGHGDPIDLDQPIRQGQRPEELQAGLDTALRRWADFALVYADPTRYADPRESLWPYQVGQPVVAGLLADPDWRPVASFTLRERDLVLLEHVRP